VVETKIEKLIERWPQEHPVPAISTDEHGTIRIPAAGASKRSSKATLMNSYDDGQQLLHQTGDLVHVDQTAFEYDITVDEAATYFLTANITTWHVNTDLLFTLTDSTDFADQTAVPVFWTNGYWNETQPIEVKLSQGKNTLHFHRVAEKPLVIKDLFLYTKKPDIPAPDPGQVPVPTPPPTPFTDYIQLSQGKTCTSQGIVPLGEKDCEIAADYLGYKYTGVRQRHAFYGCFCLVSGQWEGNCNYNANASADSATSCDPGEFNCDDARALCLRHQYTESTESSLLMI
jgi:hypothetical protein